MAEDNEKVLSFRDKILSEYHKIHFDPELENQDLNELLADILIQNALLRNILKNDPDKWDIGDIKDAAEVLSQYGITYWEFCKVMNAYAQESWEALGESTHLELYRKYFENQSLTDDGFTLNYDTHPFRVSKEGIEKYFKYEKKDGKEVEGWDLLTKTPIIINSIGECLDDEQYMYQIKYKTVTGKDFIKWVAPDILLTSNMKDLVNLGLQFIDSDQKNLKLYFKEILSHSYTINKEFTSFKNGWKKDNTILILGSSAHSATGKTEILALTEEIATEYEIKGNKKQWITTLSPLLEYDLIRLKCYAAVAALILRFIPVKSFIVHNYYESSGLKTISMQLAASILGDPLEMIRDANATKVGIEKSLEFNTDTPVFFDETSNNKDFLDVVYMIGNEQGKSRGTKDGGLEKPAHWKTIVQTTGELPLTKGNSTNTGQQIRVLEIYEGIPRLEAEYIERIRDALDNNHGLFQDEIIQEIFEWKDKFKLVYKNLNMFFEKAKSVFGDRSKTYFVALAIGGFILEEVFKKNKVPDKDYLEICNKYYKKVVIEDPTIPYYLRALDTVYSWHSRNKRLFEYSTEVDPGQNFTYTKGPIEILGWITRDAIYYDPDKLQEYLVSKGFNFERVIQDWKDNNILEPSIEKDSITDKCKYKSWKKYSIINGQRIKGVKIPFSKLKEILDIRDEEIYDMKSGKVDPEEIHVSLIEACSIFLEENPELKNITHKPEEVADMFIRSQDREELLIYGRENIVKAFAKCKKQK
jgi:uncharacterized protein (DUF927 family)